MSNAIDYSTWKQEKIDGKTYYMSPSANPKHSEVIGNLYLAFRTYLKGKQCKVFMDNIDIYLDEEANNYVIPDLSVLCEPDKFKDNGYHAVPSLIIEVISPTSFKRDKHEKYALYEKFGVKEFWLVDYQGKAIEQFVLHDGKYQLYNALALISEWDYNNRLSDTEREAYSTVVKCSILEGLEVDMKEVFE